MTKIAINGFGRIGRIVFKKILEKKSNLDVVAINDLTDTRTLAYLLKYDSLYGIYDKQVKAKDGEMLIEDKENSKQVKVLAEPDPEKLPWKEMDVDIVLECTGQFRKIEEARKHLTAGAKKVILSAPAKSDEIPTYLLGVNEADYNPEKDDIISMGSCTTNCLAPIAKIIDEEFGIIRGYMTTVHSYTNDQRILDLPHKDLRRSRAAAINIIPTTTGAAKTVEKCLPALKNKLDGLALRVPTPVVSIVDFVVQVEKETTSQEVNYFIKKKTEEPGYRGILGIEDAPLVSSDYRGNAYSSIVDALSTQAEGNLLKVLAWYDNEYGYSSRLAECASFLAERL
jgi:glyceraldehyde 3-phosphate dehydrogenase